MNPYSYFRILSYIRNYILETRLSKITFAITDERSFYMMMCYRALQIKLQQRCVLCAIVTYKLLAKILIHLFTKRKLEGYLLKEDNIFEK